MRRVNVAIAGFGKVGRRVAQLLLERRERYRAIYGADVRLVAVCGSRAGLADSNGLEAQRLDNLREGLCGQDFISSSSADIVIEAGPTNFRTGAPGGAYIRAALSAGRDVIVISKGALVREGRDLRALADASGARLKISGATAAALPTIDLIEYNLLGCAVLEVEGVLNATTNYLLGAIMERSVGFEEALKEAQAGSFAEADARHDVEGWDTACKLIILANFGLGADLDIGDVTVNGIQDITEADAARWRAQNEFPRLVGRLKRTEVGFDARVGVRTYPMNDQFAHVSGKNKAIRIRTDAMGEIFAMGGGPEPTATASAALKDLEHLLAVRSRSVHS
jgi:homoserine dehydrogenase